MRCSSSESHVDVVQCSARCDAPCPGTAKGCWQRMHTCDCTRMSASSRYMPVPDISTHIFMLFACACGAAYRHGRTYVAASILACSVRLHGRWLLSAQARMQLHWNECNQPEHALVTTHCVDFLCCIVASPPLTSRRLSMQPGQTPCSLPAGPVPDAPYAVLNVGLKFMSARCWARPTYLRFSRCFAVPPPACSVLRSARLLGKHTLICCTQMHANSRSMGAMC